MIFRVHPEQADLVAETFDRYGVPFSQRPEVRYDTGALWVLFEVGVEDGRRASRANWLFLSGELRDVQINRVVSLEDVARESLPADIQIFPSWHAAFRARGQTGRLDHSERPGTVRSAAVVHIPGYGYAVRGSVNHNSENGFRDYPQYLANNGWREDENPLSYYRSAS